MNAEQIIKEVQDNCAEWLEMSDDPATLVAGILANKIIKLQDHIEYLEKRLKNVSSSMSR
ncbi:MAG: hypothetical protein ABFD00_10540 [Chloroherpetonaceae bacterium]